MTPEKFEAELRRRCDENHAYDFSAIIGEAAELYAQIVRCRVCLGAGNLPVRGEDMVCPSCMGTGSRLRT
jgi:hypothetical protein